MARMNIKLKVPKTKSQSSTKYDLSDLRVKEFKERYAVEVENKYFCLMEEKEECEGEDQSNSVHIDIDKQWNALRDAINDVNSTMLRKKENNTKNEWMTPSILKLMEERRKHKGTNRYHEIDKEIKQKCNEEKENWLDRKCHDIEVLSRENRNQMHSEIKQFTRKHTRSGGCIKDRKGNVLFEAEDIMNRWMEYVKELFHDNRIDNTIKTYLQGPQILKSEVESALTDMRTGKAAGIDNVTTEMLQALGNFGIEVLTDLLNSMYETVYIPEDLCTSIFILLPKRPGAMECSDFRTISLMCHVLKLLLTIILRRISNKVNFEISEVQYGFRKNSGTREAIFNLKILAEKYIEVNQDIYACFIDYSKAFDSVKHADMVNYLKNIDLDENDVALIANLYWCQKTKIRLQHGLSTPLDIQKGVRQGCVMSPSLFNLYTDYIFREIDNYPGLKVGGTNINNLRYADDTVLLAETENELQMLVSKVKEESEKVGLFMNAKKTKTMCLTKKKDVPKIQIVIDNNQIEQVGSFVYLGQTITEDATSDTEIRKRIAMAKGAFSNIRPLLTNSNISLGTRLRVVKCYIWSLLLYGCETWTVNKTTESKIKAFEMWTYRRMLKISWKEKKPNKTVLEIMGKETELVETVKTRKMRYFGHIRRHNTILKTVMEGKIDGKRPQGRARKCWRDTIKDCTGEKMSVCNEAALDRDEWRIMASNLCNETEPR